MIEKEDYQALFDKNPLGTKVLEDLSTLFYDIDGYVKGDPNHAIYVEGQRSVIRFILRRIAYVSPSEEQKQQGD